LLRAGGPTLRARTPLGWCAAREPSIHALDRFGLETGPGLARPDPGPLAWRIQPAGVLLLQPLDQLGRRVVRSEAVLFPQSLAFPQRPTTQVRHHPQPDRPVHVDAHATRNRWVSASLFA